MPSAEILDFAALLAPISESQPSGIELKADKAGMAAYSTIRSAREAARDKEREAVKARLAQAAESRAESGGSNDATPTISVESLEGEATKQWKIVAEKAPTVIATLSKDLSICAWLIEALTRQHGYAGARDGFRLVREICEQFWEGIHPAPTEDEGYVETVSQLALLNGIDSEGSLIDPLRSIVIMETNSGARFTNADYFYAYEADDSATVRARRDALRAEIGRAAASVSEAYLSGKLEDAQACLEEFDKMTEVLDAKCGNDPYGEPAAPQSSKIREQLKLAIGRLGQLKGEPAGEPASNAEGDLSANQGPSGAVGASSLASGAIQTREDAFRTLLNVAAFFRRTEPHSPVSYTLEQVVRWGRMTLPELVRELIADDGIRGELAKRTGIPVTEESASESS
ncbi:MAG: hypothetical protein RIS70_1599 [Planctomycetota bacterium]